MLVKSKGIKTPNSAGRLLSYITRPNAIMLDAKGMPIIGRHNCFGMSLEALKREFEENERNRKRLYGNKQNYLYHEFLSFSPDDTEVITAEMLQDLTRRYLELRAPNGLAVYVFHADKHRHSHIVLSAVEIETGKSLRLTKEGFENAHRELQAYQLENYPELKASVIDFDKSAEYSFTHAEQQIKSRTGKSSRREELREELQNAFQESLSPEDFYTFLEQKHTLYERGGKIAGIEDNGKHFRFENLGFGEDKVNELSERETRLDELKTLREDKEPAREIVMEEAFEQEEGKQEQGMEKSDLVP